jgi:hypothetical protein
MIDAIKQARGFVTKASQLCGVSRTTFYTYLKRYTTVQEALEDQREARTDFVENKLMSAIDEGNVTAIIFYLKTQAKGRGYVEKQQREISGPDGGPVEVKGPKVDLSELTDDELDTLAAIQERLGGDRG